MVEGWVLIFLYENIVISTTIACINVKGILLNSISDL
jgi:hypothetical protein